MNFTLFHVLDAQANAIVTAQAVIENFFHAHAAAAIVAHLPHDLRSKRPLQEQATVSQIIARIAHAFGKNNSVAVHDRATFCIQILRMRYHRPRIHLIDIAIQDLDIKGLQNQHANRTKHKALQYKQRISTELIHSSPLLS